MKPKSGIKFRQSLHWHWHSFPFQALVLVLNSIKLVECLIETGSVHQNCGTLYRTISEPYITDLTLGKLKSRSFFITRLAPNLLLPSAPSIYGSSRLRHSTIPLEWRIQEQPKRQRFDRLTEKTWGKSM